MITLSVPRSELNLDLTLQSGQAFRWRKQADGSWIGIVQKRYVRLWQLDYEITAEVEPNENARDFLQSYFRLDEKLADITNQLVRLDPHLEDLCARFSGLRILGQDPTETILSFVCSSANSIPRIQNAIERLSNAYGQLICVKDSVCYHEFPDIAIFAAADANELAHIGGIGFRGRILKDVANQLLERGPTWLESLKNLPYQAAKTNLISLRGIGEKIADCVCLFSLGKDEAVPVDTHIRQICYRLYKNEKKCKSLTPAVYRGISEFFRSKHGTYAGWAQQYLFYEDLTRSRKQV